jgi:hypothetical protein
VLYKKKYLKRVGDESDEKTGFCTTKNLPSLEIWTRKNKKNKFFITYNNGNFNDKELNKKYVITITDTLRNAEVFFDKIYNEIKEFHFNILRFENYKDYKKDSKEYKRAKKYKELMELQEKDLQLLRKMRQKYNFYKLSPKVTI